MVVDESRDDCCSIQINNAISRACGLNHAILNKHGTRDRCPPVQCEKFGVLKSNCSHQLPRLNLGLASVR